MILVGCVLCLSLLCATNDHVVVNQEAKIDNHFVVNQEVHHMLNMLY